MTEAMILHLLRELLRDASYRYTDPSDYSGCNPQYYVDHEQLMSNIEKKIADCRVCRHCCHPREHHHSRGDCLSKGCFCEGFIE